MKGLLSLCALFLLVFSSCDPELNIYYSVENLTEEDVIFSSIPEFSDDPTLQTFTIKSGEMVEVGAYHFIGTTDNLEEERIYLEEIDIKNVLGAPYNKDPNNISLWEISKDGRHDGFFNLKVGPEDF